MDAQRWLDALSGLGCPFCEPRPQIGPFWVFVAKLSTSSLYLSRDQRFRGRSLLILDGPHTVGLEALDDVRAHSMFDDLLRSSRALRAATGCDLMNQASLGNQIAHLHWHLIPRFVGDSRWGAPPWTTAPDDVPAHQLPEPELLALRDAIAQSLDKKSNPSPSPFLPGSGFVPSDE